MHKSVDFSQSEVGEAGPIINIKISGNRLVGLLNTLDSLLYQAGHYRLCGNDVVTSTRHYEELYNLTESIRDELSAQRNSTTADEIRLSDLYFEHRRVREFE